jgi:hypothetical protein
MAREVGSVEVDLDLLALVGVGSGVGCWDDDARAGEVEVVSVSFRRGIFRGRSSSSTSSWVKSMTGSLASS